MALVKQVQTGLDLTKPSRPCRHQGGEVIPAVPELLFIYY